jgi:hypothetical protein
LLYVSLTSDRLAEIKHYTGLFSNVYAELVHQKLSELLFREPCGLLALISTDFGEEIFEMDVFEQLSLGYISLVRDSLLNFLKFDSFFRVFVFPIELLPRGFSTHHTL